MFGLLAGILILLRNENWRREELVMWDYQTLQNNPEGITEVQIVNQFNA